MEDTKNTSNFKDVALDPEKIHAAATWDGLKGVITNMQKTPPIEVLSHYRGLWQIEETFRISKHDLKIRPIFHWTPSRIRAHIAICYMALCCVRYLEYRVNKQYTKLSPEVIRDNLLSAQASVLVHKKTEARYLLPSATKEHVKKIYQVMGLKLSAQTKAL